MQKPKKETYIMRNQQATQKDDVTRQYFRVEPSSGLISLG